jgi:hypothetical protein
LKSRICSKCKGKLLVIEVWNNNYWCLAQSTD